MTREEIEALAMDFQTNANKMKILKVKEDEMKAEIKSFMEANRTVFNDKNQFKFECGVLVSLKMTESLEGKEEHIEVLLEKIDDKYKSQIVNEKLLIEDAKFDKGLKKIISNCNCKIIDKESFVIRK